MKWVFGEGGTQMLYNLESLTAQEESRILQQGSKSKRQSQEKQEKLVGMASGVSRSTCWAS